MVKPDLSQLTISTTKPRGKVARLLADLGIHIVPIVEDEGNVDRYVISKRLAVERRTGGGFLKGIMEKTLFTSAIYLREHFQIPVLIVEGTVNYEYSMMDPQAVRGALSSMMLQYGIVVLSSPNADETVQLLVMMARQEQIGIPEISLIPKRAATSLDDMQRRVIEMLPGCGMVMARDLLQCFGSVKRIMNATSDEFQSMRGIGARRAKEIEAVLTEEYESVDTEKNLENAIEENSRLLFRGQVVLLARQHHIYTDDQERHIVDLVYLRKKTKEIILVELKRGLLNKDSYEQICRYVDNAEKSTLLGPYMEQGFKVRGLLASIEKGEVAIARSDISVRIIDRKRAIKVLTQLRRSRMKA